MSEVPVELGVQSRPSRPWKLWAVCMAVAGALLVTWAGDRAKPLVVFPLILGAVFGSIASLAGSWCELPRHRFAVSLIMIGAIAIVPASYIVAAKRVIASEKISNPLAERLMKQVEQQAPDAARSIPSDNAVKVYLRRRYRRADMTSDVLCLIGESVLAGVTAGGMMLLVWRGRKEETQA